MKEGTYWFLYPTATQQFFAVKVAVKTSPSFTFLLREVTLLHKDWHFNGEQLILPSSYKPYMDNQNFVIVKTTDEISYGIDDTWSLWFFGEFGTEMRNDKNDIAIDASGLDWKKPLLGDFEKMRHLSKASTPDDSVEKSEDGERHYVNSGTVSSNLKSLQLLFDEWKWTEGLPALADKMVEEANEMRDGGFDKPVHSSKNDWTFVGTSAASEAITCGIISLKFLYMSGVDVNSAMRLFYQRHKEQYDRYNKA